MISVCIATYNGGSYIRPQLDSILSQLSPGDEVIVSDDGSTDDTLSAVRSMQTTSPCPIHILSNAGAHGYTPNFENALRHARGEYIFLSDQDDVWLPGKLQRMLQSLQSGHTLVVSNARITDDSLHVTCEDYFAARGVHEGFWGNIFKFGYLGCCLAFDRSVLQHALPFPADHRYCTHDHWLFLCGQTFGCVEVLQEPLLLYRRHGDTLTTGALNAHRPLSFRIRYRLYLLWHIACRKLFNR